MPLTVVVLEFVFLLVSIANKLLMNEEVVEVPVGREMFHYLLALSLILVL